MFAHGAVNGWIETFAARYGSNALLMSVRSAAPRVWRNTSRAEPGVTEDPDQTRRPKLEPNWFYCRAKGDEDPWRLMCKGILVWREGYEVAPFDLRRGDILMRIDNSKSLPGWTYSGPVHFKVT